MEESGVALNETIKKRGASDNGFTEQSREDKVEDSEDELHFRRNYGLGETELELG